MRLFNKIFRKTKKAADTVQGDILLSEDVMRKLPTGKPNPDSQNIIVIGKAGDGHGFVSIREKIRMATLQKEREEQSKEDYHD